MCFIGPQGRDIGLALSFPIGCLICFGLNGQIEANESIEVYITSSLDEYLELMSEAGKSANEQRCLWGGGAKVSWGYDTFSKC